MSAELLKKHKIRVTPFRIKVLSVFKKTHSALSLSDLESGIGEFDRVTLYRTIKTFLDKGIIHEILMPGDIKKMALCQDGCNTHLHDHKHLHFHCDSCQETFCIDLPAYPEIVLDGFDIKQIEIQAQGVCKNCG
ncbi:MAG: transcriptional repressor [Crocinitomicaceae bacterium]|nr:transcriptional repressor [Crocinitomicaceae bacterium]